MHWLHALDVGLFRFINGTLSNPIFDFLMPYASGKDAKVIFFPFVVLAGILLIWKGGARGRLCALMLALIIGPGDALISNTIKHLVNRPRPFVTLPDVRLPASKGNKARTEAMASEENPVSPKPNYNSMPSSHAANWFAATMILLIYYRRSIFVMLPLACIVAFSRIYNGVHYPSDVLAGAILGAGYAAATIVILNSLWKFAGRRWFPLWWEKLPSLLNPDCRTDTTASETESTPAVTRHSSIEAHWLRLGYLVIALTFAGRLLYIASGLIELSGDEAYQWVWSKHPALWYYSKPPLIAYTQWLGTHLWGDNEFGVRFFSPVIGAVLGFLLLQFFAREVNARAGFFFLLIVTATPLMAAGGVLMTVDPLSVLFWTAAMLSGWRAVQPDAKLAPWIWTGLWMGLGFLSKYTELFQWLCWVVFFILWKPARAHLRRPGPYLALLINLLCALPVVIWNQQHGWVTVSHVVSDNARLGTAWKPTLRYFFNFIGAEVMLLNPIFLVATVWAAIAFWRRRGRDPRLVYLFSMGAPLFLCYLLFTFHSNVLPNWIAPSVLPLFCLTVCYWETRWRLGRHGTRPWFIAGMIIGLTIITVMHETDLIQVIVGKPLPPKIDPLTRVRAYDELAQIVGEARTKLLAEGKPAFVIGNHYETTSMVNFYLPEAKTNLVTNPLAYCVTTERPVNQYYFWPGYLERKGQNAIFVRELNMPGLVPSWIPKWLNGQINLNRTEPVNRPAPAVLQQQFESVTNLGLYNVLYRDRVFHIIQLFECRNLR